MYVNFSKVAAERKANNMPVSGKCDSAWKCALTVSGPIENMLVDGSDFSMSMHLQTYSHPED